MCAVSRAAHPFLCCDTAGDKVCVVAADGTIKWQYACDKPEDCWALPNGNYLFCYYSGAREMTPDKRTVWQYKAPPKVEIHACQPLSDGSVMVVESGTSRILEIDRHGAVVKQIALKTLPTIATHNQFRGARKTKDGHYRVCFKAEHKVVELDGDGRVLRQIPTPDNAHGSWSLPDGNLLVSCPTQVFELNPKRQVVWQVAENDIPGNPLRIAAGCERLPNGNTVICNYLGHGYLGKQPQVVEITRDKKVVWEFADHAHFKSISQIQVFDVLHASTRDFASR
jgi:hypothetical protein